jgi:hypothetical protein
MPSPEQLIRTAVGLPWAITRRVVGIGLGLLPGMGSSDASAETRYRTDIDLDSAIAAEQALGREREPVEEAIFTPDDDFFEDDHLEAEIELVAESSDPDATEPPGAQIHVDEPWEGYRRMKVAEITARLEGKSPELLAAVELYETTHRKRRGVLAAVETASRT